MRTHKIRLVITCIILLVMVLNNSIFTYAAVKKPTKIEVVTNAKTVDYCVGDSVNTKGLSVRVIYDDDSSSVISSGYQAKCDLSKAGKQSVEISYEENSTTVITSYDVVVHEKPSIEISDLVVEPGGYFSLPIKITGNCGLMGFDLKVDYDSDVLLPLSVDKGNLITDGFFDDSVATAEKGSFDIIWSGSSEITEDGQLCTIKFQCKEDTEVENTNITVSNVRKNTYRENYNTILCVESTATISIEQKQEVIEKKPLDNLVLKMDNWDVSEEPSKPSLTGNEGNGNVIYTYALMGSVDYTDTIPTKAGTYVIKAQVEETENYKSGIATCVFTITDKSSDPKPVEKKSLDNLVLKMDSWSIDEDASTPELTGNKGNGEVRYTYALVGSSDYTDTIPNEVGTYVIKATVEETEEYYGGIATCIFKITDKKTEPSPVKKSPLNELTLVMPGWRVGDKVPTPILTGNQGNGAVSYTYAVVGSDKYSNKIPSTAGTYIVKATVSETENYYSGVATCIFTITANNRTIVKKDQSISTNANSYTVIYNKTLTIKAVSSGKGKITFKSSNPKIAVINNTTGKITAKGIGKVTITITAAENSAYKAATKNVTVIVRPSTQKVTYVKSLKKSTVNVKWVKDTKVSGYEIQISTNSKFSKNLKTYGIRTYKTYSKSIAKLKTGKTYYIRIRSYKTIGKQRYYGNYSVSKKIKVK